MELGSGSPRRSLQLAMISRRGVLACLLAPLAQDRRAPTRLSVSSNQRYLQDASGTPLFLVGDCPQNMPLKLAIPELDNFMADCDAKGFNMLWICMDGQESGGLATKPPIDRNHNLMMKSGWDIGTLNEPYFVTIDAIANAAQQYGIYCMFTPLSECQWHRDKILANTASNWYRYGTFVGKRYKDQSNIIWQIGNDNITVEAQHAVVRGIKDAGDTHLMTVNWRPGFHHEGSGWIVSISMAKIGLTSYAWYINTPIREGGAPCYWQKIEYERPNPMPTFATEVHYQQPYAKATDLDCRMQNYYVALGGGCGGHVYGSGFLANEWDYNTYKNNGGRLQAIHFKNLFVGREWTSLVPDYGHRFITGGFGALVAGHHELRGCRDQQWLTGHGLLSAGGNRCSGYVQTQRPYGGAVVRSDERDVEADSGFAVQKSRVAHLLHPGQQQRRRGGLGAGVRNEEEGQSEGQLRRREFLTAWAAVEGGQGACSRLR